VWLVGARGSIATCVCYGLAGLREGLIDPVGLVTDARPFESLGFVGWEELVLGGHDVCQRSLTKSAGELVSSGILSAGLVAAAAPEAAAFEARIRPGVLDGPDVGVADLDPDAARLGGLAPREQVEAIASDLRAFRESQELDRVVVVNVSSTESGCPPRPEWESLQAFEVAVDAGEAQPASCIYAYAALRERCPHVNFTPNLGASIPALKELALEVGVPHCGNDGKTGETLLKTTLAPMFKARALRVLSWQGYNMLGNRDGVVLSDPVRRQSKLRNKDEALRAILGDDDMHTHVGIDYVPSLEDWKTAWDFVHFEGFLGVKMSLQFTWQGSDSALAAPLVLDLVRFADLAAERGESGAMAHVGAFFKSPLAGEGHDFHAQFERLRAYAAGR
jgi:myo-inositol-1-phosphate synthase